RTSQLIRLAKTTADPTKQKHLLREIGDAAQTMSGQSDSEEHDGKAAKYVNWTATYPTFTKVPRQKLPRHPDRRVAGIAGQDRSANYYSTEGWMSLTEKVRVFARLLASHADADEIRWRSLPSSAWAEINVWANNAEEYFDDSNKFFKETIFTAWTWRVLCKHLFHCDEKAYSEPWQHHHRLAELISPDLLGDKAWPSHWQLWMKWASTMLFSHYGGPVDPKQLENLFLKEFECMRMYITWPDNKAMLELLQNAMELDACFRTASATIVIQFHDPTTLKKKGFPYRKERTNPWGPEDDILSLGFKELGVGSMIDFIIEPRLYVRYFSARDAVEVEEHRTPFLFAGRKPDTPAPPSNAAQQNGGATRRSKPTRGEPTRRKKQQVESKRSLVEDDAPVHRKQEDKATDVQEVGLRRSTRVPQIREKNAMREREEKEKVRQQELEKKKAMEEKRQALQRVKAKETAEKTRAILGKNNKGASQSKRKADALQGAKEDGAARGGRAKRGRRE
ncbi:hypothetical protein S7711_03707, partial [Stachybotrys chartarum IBT 7711]